MQEHNPVKASSRIEDLKREIDAIVQCPKADEATAVKAVTILLANYPNQQNPDPRIAQAMVRQMVTVCRGVDLDVLRDMVDLNSSSSLVRQKPSFMPNPPEMAEWISAKMEPKRARIGWYLDEIATLERQAEQPVSNDERQKNADTLRNLARVIRRTAKTLQRASRKPIQASPKEAAEARLEALRQTEEYGVK